MAGAGSAKLSYVLLQKLLKLAEFLPRRRDPAAPAADSKPADIDANGNTSNGNISNGNSSNGNINSNGSSGSGGNSSGSRNSSGKDTGGFCFKYVITDFSHANFGFWMNHPRLQELFTLGIIDFAVFDAEADKGSIGGERPGQPMKEKEEEGAAAEAAGESGARANGSGLEPGVGLWGSGCLRLELSGEEIRPGDLENPVIVVANYVFDSLKQDAFRCGIFLAPREAEGVGCGVLAGRETRDAWLSRFLGVRLMGFLWRIMWRFFFAFANPANAGVSWGKHVVFFASAIRAFCWVFYGETECVFADVVLVASPPRRASGHQ